MPLVTITMRAGRSREYRKAILEAVHESLVKAFRIPDSDRNQRVIEVGPDNLEHTGRSEDFLTIEMTVFPGRSPQAKKALYGEIVSRLQGLGIKGDDVLIILHEPPLENWGIRGGHPANEVDIGFKLDV